MSEKNPEIKKFALHMFTIKLFILLSSQNCHIKGVIIALGYRTIEPYCRTESRGERKGGT